MHHSSASGTMLQRKGQQGWGVAGGFRKPPDFEASGREKRRCLDNTRSVLHRPCWSQPADGPPEHLSLQPPQNAGQKGVQVPPTLVTDVRQLLIDNLGEFAANKGFGGLPLCDLLAMFQQRFGYDLELAIKAVGDPCLANFIRRRAGDLVDLRTVDNVLVAFPRHTFMPGANNQPERKKEEGSQRDRTPACKPARWSPTAQEDNTAECRSTTDEHLPVPTVTNAQMLHDLCGLVSHELRRASGCKGVPLQQLLELFQKEHGYSVNHRQFGFDRMSLFLKSKLGHLVLVSEDKKKAIHLLPCPGMEQVVSPSSNDEREGVEEENAQKNIPARLASRGLTLLDGFSLLLRQEFLEERFNNWKRDRDKALKGAVDMPTNARNTLNDPTVENPTQTSKSSIPEDTSAEISIGGTQPDGEVPGAKNRGEISQFTICPDEDLAGLDASEDTGSDGATTGPFGPTGCRVGPKSRCWLEKLNTDFAAKFGAPLVEGGDCQPLLALLQEVSDPEVVVSSKGSLVEVHEKNPADSTFEVLTKTREALFNMLLPCTLYATTCPTTKSVTSMLDIADVERKLWEGLVSDAVIEDAASTISSFGCMDFEDMLGSTVFKDILTLSKGEGSTMVAPVFDPYVDMRLFLEGQMARVAGRLCDTKPQASDSARMGFEARPLPLTHGLALRDAEEDFFRLFQYKFVAGEYGGISRAMGLLSDICELRRGIESIYFHPTEIFLLRLALEDCLKGVGCPIDVDGNTRPGSQPELTGVKLESVKSRFADMYGWRFSDRRYREDGFSGVLKASLDHCCTVVARGGEDWVCGPQPAKLPKQVQKLKQDAALQRLKSALPGPKDAAAPPKEPPASANPVRQENPSPRPAQSEARPAGSRSTHNQIRWEPPPRRAQSAPRTTLPTGESAQQPPKGLAFQGGCKPGQPQASQGRGGEPLNPAPASRKLAWGKNLPKVDFDGMPAELKGERIEVDQQAFSTLLVRRKGQFVGCMDGLQLIGEQKNIGQVEPIQQMPAQIVEQIKIGQVASMQQVPAQMGLGGMQLPKQKPIRSGSGRKGGGAHLPDKEPSHLNRSSSDGTGRTQMPWATVKNRHAQAPSRPQTPQRLAPPPPTPALRTAQQLPLQMIKVVDLNGGPTPTSSRTTIQPPAGHPFLRPVAGHKPAVTPSLPPTPALQGQFLQPPPPPPPPPPKLPHQLSQPGLHRCNAPSISPKLPGEVEGQVSGLQLHPVPSAGGRSDLATSTLRALPPQLGAQGSLQVSRRGQGVLSGPQGTGPFQLPQGGLRTTPQFLQGTQRTGRPGLIPRRPPIGGAQFGKGVQGMGGTGLLRQMPGASGDSVAIPAPAGAGGSQQGLVWRGGGVGSRRGRGTLGWL